MATAILLPADVQEVHQAIDPPFKKRVVSDFVAGMTDQYAAEYYRRLFSEAPQTIFKRV